MANEKLRALSQQRKWAHQKLLTLQSPTYQGFLADGTGHLPGRHPEQETKRVDRNRYFGHDSLRGPACNGTSSRRPKMGPRPRKSWKAIDVGMEMGGGPSTASARFALEVMVDAGLINNN